ncbi:hypothetical protein QTG54_003447 [Skeletonema marinoi]|uniref:Ricin B lectin domain-containing protein n=1 Tax=Skeletonema marinoi TaxID=267567 RepID=A0AAD8YFX6_9STRA|nr:hypothetical protein QTG54_003447 [Skeletonema marinoi]
MKLGLVIALILATGATIVAQEDEIQYAPRILSRLDSGGRRKKVKDKLEKLKNKKDKGKSPNKPSKKDSSKSSKSDYKDSMFLVPFSCPRKCIDGAVQPNDTELDNAIKDCDEKNDSQKWNIHYKNEFMKIEATKDWCIGVEEVKTCQGKKAPLSLVSCSDPRSDWYFTGGQLVSALCWSRGKSRLMYVDDDCEGSLKLYDKPDRGTLFMFVGKEFVASASMEDEPTLSPTNYPTLSPTVSEEPTDTD